VRSFRWLHLFLGSSTLLTLAVAGGSFWDPVEPPIEYLSEFLVPAKLWLVLRAGIPYAVWTFLILAAHEMGHYLACRRYGIPATLPFFLPSIPPLGTFGAVIRIRGAIPHRKALFDVAAAGPIAGFLLAVPVLVYGLLRAEPFELPAPLEGLETWRLGEPVLLTVLSRLLTTPGEMAANGWIGAGWVGLLVTSLNLFPVGQLDGGHVAYALSHRLHRVLARVTLVAMAGVIVIQVVVYRHFPVYAMWFAILLWMRDRHPRLMDERTPLGPGRRALALVLVAIFALSFILMPLYIS